MFTLAYISKNNSDSIIPSYYTTNTPGTAAAGGVYVWDESLGVWSNGTYYLKNTTGGYFWVYHKDGEPNASFGAYHVIDSNVADNETPDTVTFRSNLAINSAYSGIDPAPVFAVVDGTGESGGDTAGTITGFEVTSEEHPMWVGDVLGTYTLTDYQSGYSADPRVFSNGEMYLTRFADNGGWTFSNTYENLVYPDSGADTLAALDAAIHDGEHVVLDNPSEVVNWFFVVAGNIRDITVTPIYESEDVPDDSDTIALLVTLPNDLTGNQYVSGIYREIGTLNGYPYYKHESKEYYIFASSESWQQGQYFLNDNIEDSSAYLFYNYSVSGSTSGSPIGQYNLGVFGDDTYGCPNVTEYVE